MKYLDRKNTFSVKWDFPEILFGKKDLLPLWVADMDFECPFFVNNIIKDRAEHNLYGYSSMIDDPKTYFEPFIPWFKKYGLELDSNRIFFIPGVVTGINFVIDTLTEVGDKVIIQPPVYTPFYSSIEGNKRVLVENRLILNDGSYSIDFNNLETQASSGAKLMILCSPHNPVGRVWTIDELKRIVEICRKNEIILISDEIHCDLVYDEQKFVSTSSVADYDKIFTFFSPSKTFNVAGLKTAFGTSKNDILLKRVKERLETFHITTGSIQGMLIARACYEFGNEWYLDLMIQLNKNRVIIREFLDEKLPKAIYKLPESTYLAWVDFSNYTDDVEILNDRLLNVGKVFISPGSLYGEEEKRYYRINFGTSEEILLDGLQRIVKSIESL
ncbi:MAG: PatB family C-S lyase [Candidatus Delongbacteria bacterium]|nr:PatB family C-S lyase [Candidatus Delongbacteria bacterium]MBN2836793.1 PatB family C-S lyase [Candidatus Delongbacteria bacterium]